VPTPHGLDVHTSYKILTLPHIRPPLPPLCPTPVPSGLLVPSPRQWSRVVQEDLELTSAPRRRCPIRPQFFGQSTLIDRATISSPLPVSIAQMAGVIHNLNDRVAHSAFGRYFLLEGSGHPKERKGARFTTELRGGLTTFSAMVHLS